MSASPFCRILFDGAESHFCRFTAYVAYKNFAFDYSDSVSPIWYFLWVEDYEIDGRSCSLRVRVFETEHQGLAAYKGDVRFDSGECAGTSDKHNCSRNRERHTKHKFAHHRAFRFAVPCLAPLLSRCVLLHGDAFSLRPRRRRTQVHLGLQDYTGTREAAMTTFAKRLATGVKRDILVDRI
jgi:hypothetical protein